MTKVAVIGAKGQLGSDLVKSLSVYDLVPLGHSDIEICDHTATGEMLRYLKPDVVINTAAYHQVDDCEDYVERALQVNAVAPRNLAALSEELGYVLVHLSTDYVFGGEKRTPYREQDPPDPLNAYGVSKLAGEHLVRRTSQRHFVIRSSGLYGTAGAAGKGGNFVEMMLRRAKEGSPIRVVDDQVLSPTFTEDLARSIRELIEADDAFGLYHVTNGGECSWYEFATKVFDLLGLRPELAATSSQEFGAKAQRPTYSVLANERLGEAGFSRLRPWEDALADYLVRKGHLALPGNTNL